DTTTALGRLRQRLRDNAPTLTTTNATVARAWETAVDDLASLPLGWDGGPAAPIAGLPLYQQFFGRDTLTIGWQAAMVMPEMLRDLIPARRRVLDWLDHYADLDGDGLLEYMTRSRKGVKNQGWKDSDDAIVDERGEIVPNPIATSETQAYWYVGLQQAALAL